MAIEWCLAGKSSDGKTDKTKKGTILPHFHLRFVRTVFKIVYGAFVEGCREISLSVVAYWGDEEPTTDLNLVNSVVMFWV